MAVYKMFGAGTGGTENDLASIDVQFDGDITAIAGFVNADLKADDDSVTCEISFLSTNTTTANDARGSLWMINSRLSFTTSGAGQGTVPQSVSGLRIPVARGERIHLHTNATAGVASACHVYIYVEDSADATLRRRR